MIQCIQFDIASLRRHELGVSWYFVVFFTYYRKEKFNVGFFNDMHIDIASLTGSPLVTIDWLSTCDYVHGHGRGHHL